MYRRQGNYGERCFLFAPIMICESVANWWKCSIQLLFYYLQCSFILLLCIFFLGYSIKLSLFVLFNWWVFKIELLLFVLINWLECCIVRLIHFIISNLKSAPEIFFHSFKLSVHFQLMNYKHHKFTINLNLFLNAVL